VCFRHTLVPPPRSFCFSLARRDARGRGRRRRRPAASASARVASAAAASSALGAVRERFTANARVRRRRRRQTIAPRARRRAPRKRPRPPRFISPRRANIFVVVASAGVVLDGAAAGATRDRSRGPPSNDARSMETRARPSRAPRARRHRSTRVPRKAYRARSSSSERSRGDYRSGFPRTFVVRISHTRV
jgi:hypothetical protein